MGWWYQSEHNIFTHSPKDPELRNLSEDENHEGFLQTTHPYSRVESGKSGGLSTASIRSRGTRLGCSMDTTKPV